MSCLLPPQLPHFKSRYQDFAQLRVAHRQLQADHNTLKAKYKVLKREHVGLVKSSEQLARKHGRDLKRMNERHAIQESSVRRELQAACARAEIAENELSTKDEEIKELRDSKLLFKKKVGPRLRPYCSVPNGQYSITPSNRNNRRARGLRMTLT